MSIAKDLPLFRKMYAFTALMHRTAHNMPREYRYSLGAESLRIAWNCLDLVAEIAGLAKAGKKEKIPALSAEFNRLKLRVRMLAELKIISARQFAHWQENYLDEAGSQIGGWQKWAEKPMEKE